MIIKALTIENFKGIREPVCVEFKPITLLFGPNSAGKSTVVQALHYARELLERQNADADLTLQGGEFVDLGGFENLVHGHDRKLPVVLRFELDLSSEDLPEYHFGNRSGKIHSERELQLQEWNLSHQVSSAWVSLTVNWSDWRNRPFINQYEVGINGEFFAQIRAAEDSRRVWISAINFAHSLFISSDSQQSIRNEHEPPSSRLELLCEIVTTVRQSVYIHPTENTLRKSLVLDLEQQSAIPKWGGSICISENCLQDLSIHGDDSDVVYDEFTFYLNQLIVGPGELLRDALRKFRYLGPIRELPPRNHKPLRSEDESRWASGLAAWDLMYKASPSFLKEVNEWLSREDRLDSGYSLRMIQHKKIDINSALYGILTVGNLLEEEEDISQLIRNLPEERQLVLIDEQRSLEVMPQDIGIGISQILPVVVAALDSNAAIVAVEQPELHIHPRLQVGLGDLFISQIQNGVKLFLVETHSEHLLLRLLRRIRETTDDELPPGISELRPDDLSINYIEQSSSGLVVRQLLVSPDGDSFGEWPAGFFEERAGEIY
jgi:hypothetical protein